MENSAYTMDSNLLGENLALKQNNARQVGEIEKLERDLQDANRRQDETQAAASKAKREAQTSKSQFDAAVKGHDQDMRSVTAKYDKVVTAGDAMKRKFHELADRMKADRNEIEALKLKAKQDSQQYEASKRSLELRVHVAETRLEVLVEEVEKERAQLADEANFLRMTYEQRQPQEERDCSLHSDSGMHSPVQSPGERNTRTLGNEYSSRLRGNDNQEHADTDSSCGSRDTGTDMQSWKAPIQTSDYCDTGVQVDFDDLQDEEQTSPVESVGLDIMERLDELALICGDLGLKSVKIYRSADWMVVLFP